MLKEGDVVKLNYNQSLVLGKIKEIGSIKGQSYILLVDVVYMIPVKRGNRGVEFSLNKDKSPIYFIGGGYFLSILEIDDDLYKKYLHAMSGLVLVPGSKMPQ